jgi:hypothetical protein
LFAYCKAQPSLVYTRTNAKRQAAVLAGSGKMARTVLMLGSVLKVGDVVISTGYRRTLTGVEQYYFQARAVDNNLPPGYDAVTMAKSTDGLWTVEV